jgi:hypothetical protein
MCQVDWAEARWFVQPIVTAIGIGVSVAIAMSIPRRHKRQDRVAYARAASVILEETLDRIWDRLEIRFDLPSYARTGRRMRQHRSDGALATLLDLKVGEMPVELVPSFSKARSSLRALNEGMNGETQWPPEPRDIERYRVVAAATIEAIEEFNEAGEAFDAGKASIPRAAVQATTAVGSTDRPDENPTG